MLQETFYDPVRDLGEASQSGYVDLYQLLGNGVLPANLNVTAESFNDIEDPKSIYGKPSDQFEAMSMAKELNKRGAAAQKLYNERMAAEDAAKV